MRTLALRRGRIPALVPAWLALALPLAVAGGERIVCWTDEHGKRACGDQVPARYAKVERQVFNERGIVVEKFPPEPTSAEREAAAEKARLSEQEQRRQRDQAAYDRYLFESYASLKDLEEMRDSRLAVLDNRIALTDKSVTADEVALAALQERLDQLEDDGKEPSAPLLKQQKTLKDSLASNRTALEQLRAERDKTRAQFERDIARYQELRGARPAMAGSDGGG